MTHLRKWNGEGKPVWIISLMFFAAMFALPVVAEEMEKDLLQRLEFTGSIRASGWAHSLSLDQRKDIAVAAFWLKVEPRLGQDTLLVLEGWGMNSDVVQGAAQKGKIREAYLSSSVGSLDFRIGKQLIIWGKADRFNPTDNLSPRDYTLLVPEDEDQRLGVNSIKATYNAEALSVTAIWEPRFNPNILPLPSTPGLSFSEFVRPSNQVALKVEQSGQDVDWSASYFKGADINPDISLSSFTANGTFLRLDYHQIRVLGADAATVIGQYNLRAEGAYTVTEDAVGGNPFVKNPFVYLVVGGDRTIDDNLNVNLQYFMRRVENYSDPRAIANPLLQAIAIQSAVVSNQLERFQQGLIFRVSDKWINETLEAEVAGVYSFTNQDYVVKPKIIYAFDDHWRGTIGAALFRGNSETYYGRLRNNSTTFIEIKYGF
ncbi:MAG: hypothetical protein PHH47_00510 [Gallionella sp.]|nr:hypothetical protein [Gallionella sp.]MDD4946894.1 hypothetical protein [Gallionella sp.]